jgi:predicted aspartyl protease
MKFDYTAIISSSPDTSDIIVIFRPEVRIKVHSPNGSGDFLALVDTGADNTILPESIAHDLGIPLFRGKGPAATAFGGQEIALSYSDIELELVHPESNLRWMARVHFVVEIAEKGTLILGHQGFLEYFTATFKGEDCTLDLEANDYLPKIAGIEKM